MLARPYALPIFVPALVFALAALDAPLSQVSVKPLPILSTASDARDALGLLWQIEGTILALVAAVVLFVFEGMARARSEISIWEYAGRSGLAQFLMLGAAGTMAIPIALYWPSPRPPLTAAHVAGLASLAGIAFLPFLFYQATRVIDPNWLRGQRLKDIRATVSELVEAEAVQRLSLAELSAWVEGRRITIGRVFAANSGNSVEIASKRSTVFDINLSRLRSQADTSPHILTLTARIGQAVSEGAALVIADGVDDGLGRRSIYTLADDPGKDRLSKLLNQLREEAVEAIRSESVSGIEATAATYVELWLAWPKAWQSYQQRLAVGFLRELEPFRLVPVDELTSHIRALLQSAVKRGLPEHVTALTGIVFYVGKNAIDLGATDILDRVCGLARSFVNVTGTDPAPTKSLESAVNGRAWRLQVDLCKWVAGPRLEDTQLSLSSRQAAVEAVEVLYRSLSESMKLLFQVGALRDFESLSKELSNDLRYWRIEHQADLSRYMQRRASGRQDDIVAGDTFDEAATKTHLQFYRSAHMLSVLGWILHSLKQDGRNERIEALAVGLGRQLGSLDQLFGAAELALFDGHDLLSRWLMMEEEPREAHFVDVEGPILTAVALAILTIPRPTQLPIADWISKERVTRLLSIIRELLEVEGFRQILRRSEEGAEQTVGQYTELFEQALKRQEFLEEERLIAQRLDPGKVDAFAQSAIATWAESSVLQDLLTVTDVSPRLLPTSGWEGTFLGTRTLLPKGPFVSPSNWAGADILGGDVAHGIVLGEVSVIVELVARNAAKMRGKGTILARTSRAIEDLRTAGYLPSVIFAPFDVGLHRSLGLADWSPPNPAHGPLGHYVKGEIDGVPVVYWHGAPQDRVLVADLARCIDILEGATDAGELAGLSCEVTFVDSTRALEIVRSWNVDSRDVEGKIRSVLAKVYVDVRRFYRPEMLDRSAARSLWIPPAERQQPG